MSSLPIAIVIPWFGRDQRGGAERHAWELAARLVARNLPVEVITTCCRAHQEDWATNHLPAGISEEPEGFTIRRFAVAPRNRDGFDRVNAKLMGLSKTALLRGVPVISAEEEEIFATELMRSPELIDHLRVHADGYRAFIFIPYLYFTALRGLPLVAERSILVPCLHHESYAFLKSVSEIFYKAKKLLFNSPGELRLAAWIYGPSVYAKGLVAGEGIDYKDALPKDGSVEIGAIEPFVLCLGRQDAGKNTDFLANAFAVYRKRYPGTALKLVLAGPGNVPMPADAEGIKNLGPVSEAAKFELLKGCRALFNPSTNESYSRVIMEAWLSGRPIAVHRDCLATATAVTEGHNGWIAGSEEEWVQTFARVMESSSEVLAKMGEHGRIYAKSLADWDMAMDRYEAAIHEVGTPVGEQSGESRGAIHQVLPNLASGDAISNAALWIREFLRKQGYKSEIFALDIAPAVADVAQPWRSGCAQPDSALLYHHSIGSALTREVCEHPGSKAMIYHNITPDRFLESYLPHNAVLCRNGRAQLPELARYFPISRGPSIFNAIELSECSFSNPGVLPLCVDPGKWNLAADPGLMDHLQEGHTNILFVGRLSPNKRQEDLILAFAHYRKMDATARLHLVGGAGSPGDLYESCLRKLVEYLGLGDSVNFAGKIDDASLLAYYRTAHLFWSMSEHEGFCVPLIEAMWFDVPVFAYASSAIPETMADAGRLFHSKADSARLASQAFDLIHNPSLRESVLNRQRSRREDFLPSRIEEPMRALIAAFKDGPQECKGNESETDRIESVREVAVVKLDHIGDVLLASPTFFSLSQRFPGARITAVVAPSAAPILKNNPYVHRILPFDPPWFWRELGASAELRRRTEDNWKAMQELTAVPFDLVVNLRSDHANVLFAASLPHRFLLSYTNDSAYAFLITHRATRTRGMHATVQHRELLRSIGADFWCEPTIYFTKADLERALAIGSPNSTTVVMALGAGVELKRWSPIKFRELARRLRNRGLRVALIGSKADARYSEDWSGLYGCENYCGQFSLTELAAYLSRAGCLVANDSAPMHIGAAAKIPLVYLMRPSVREEFAPVGVGHVCCCESVCERPCIGFDPSQRDRTPQFCKCIQSVGVDRVESAVLEMLGRRNAGAEETPRTETARLSHSQ